MTTSRIPAVPSKPLKPSKPSVVRLDQPVPPKEMVTSTDHSKLRRLPSFTTYLRPAADSTASKYVGSNKSIPRKDLHLNEDNKILRETLPRESIEHYDSRSMPGCERDNFSGDIKNLSLFDRERENGQARKSTDLLTKPKGASNFYEQLQSPLGEYSEVLDTPWQRSDQPDGSDPRTESLDRGHKDTDSNSDAPVFVGYSTPKKNAACTMSGPIYEHQITVGQDTEDPEWYQFSITSKLPLLNDHSPSSRPWITSSGTEGPTIPETPNAFRETNDAGSGSPEVVKCTPVATQDLTTGPVSTAQSSPISMLSESDNTKPDDLPMTAHDALRQSQQADQTATREPYGKGASCSAELDDTCEASTNHHPSNETSVNKETVSNVALPESLVPLHVGDRVADNDLCSAKSSLNRHGDASMNDQDVGEGEKPTPKSMVEDSRPTTPCPEEPCNDVMPPHRVGTGNTPVSETTSESQPRRRVTNRERARMALAAAGGQRLTTAEIVDWNLQMFPHLNEKQISLERNITAVLSIFSEFKGKKILGARGNKQLWGFADTNIQRQYQREYAGYYTSLANPTAQRKDRVLVAHLDSSNATTKRQDDARPGLKEVMDGRPIDEVATPDKSEAMLEDVVVAESEECDTSSSASPDTHGSHQALSIDSLSGGRFFEECFSHQTPLLEAMTQTDIDRKVSEIKQRPSRKRFFGPEHRLAHVRRYGRQDIHDESEGAWKQGLYDKVKTTAGSTSADVGSKDGEGVATVRQLFNLPKNAIPMNSGQTELAFRDGTLVSTLASNLSVSKHKRTNLQQQIGGKLPRPRQIHKVGKMFGGELTIRTS
jgi:hypothetical protein